MMTMHTLRRILFSLTALLIAGCTTVSSLPGSRPLEAGAKWVLLPLENHTDTPQAALSAESLAEHALRLRGIDSLVRYPATLSRDSLFEPSERRVTEEAQKWAREQGARYGLSGAVEEWRYKVGIDGEPAVGITLQVIELSSGQVVWSASGAKSGWSRDALSGVAQKLLTDLLGGLRLQAKTDSR